MKTQSSDPDKKLINVREKIIYKQLLKMLPADIEPLSLLFCAYEFRKQYDQSGYNPNYKKN